MSGYEVPACESPWFCSPMEYFSIYEMGVLKGKVISNSKPVLSKYGTIINFL